MTSAPSSPNFADADYETIEAAVMETERGRWFLKEYARRIRAAETNDVMSALARIEGNMQRGAAAFGADVEARQLAGRLEAMQERMRDLVWRLRELGAEGASQAIESELGALIALDKQSPSSAPALTFSRDRQDESDGALSQRLRSVDGDGSKAAPIPALPKAAASADSRLAAFAAIETLSIREKLDFFV